MDEKQGYLKIDLSPMSVCNFHKPLFDVKTESIIYENCLAVHFGYDQHFTMGFVICPDCWEKLKSQMDELMRDYFMK